MRHIFTFLVIIICSINTSAQASDNASNYIMQKQLRAAQIKLHSEMKVVQLRHQPKNLASFVNTTPMVVTDEIVAAPPSAADLNAIETAAGGNSAKDGSSKAAKISIK